MTIKGTKGNDTLTGTGAADTFDLSQGGNDIVSGAGGKDTFLFKTAFTAKDEIDGGSGNDTLSLDGNYAGSHAVTFSATTMKNVEKIVLGAGHSYALTTNSATVASGAALTIDAHTLAAANHLTFNGAAETNGAFHITGGAGSDSVLLSNARVTSNSTFSGGAGNDTLELKGNFSGGATFGAGELASVETLKLDNGHSYNIDSLIAAGKTMTVDASALGHSFKLIFSGVSQHEGFHFMGGAGNDTLSGGRLSNTFDLSKGGNDNALGGDANDTFNMGAAYTAGDIINGGAGADTLALNGNYATLTTLSDTNVMNIEALQLGGGFHYHLAISGGITEAGALTINAAAAGSVNLDLSAAALTSGTITGSTGDDSVNFGANLSAYTFTGGGGNDTIVLDGDYSGDNAITVGALTFSEIGNIVLGVQHSYDITTANSFVDTGATLVIDASALGTNATGDELLLNVSAETDGFFTITGGTRDDTITFGNAAVVAGSTFDGNGGNDTVNLSGDFSSLTDVTGILTNVGTLHLDTAHTYNLKETGELNGGNALDLTTTTLGGNVTFTMTSTATGSVGFNGSGGDDTLVIAASSQDNYFNGNGGNDTVELNGDFSIASTFGADTLNGAENLKLDAGHDYDVVLDASSAGSALTVDASALGSGNSMVLDFSAESSTAFTITGGAGADTVAVGANVSEITSINLGGGANTLAFGGDYSAGYDFGTLALTSVGTLRLDAGGQYNLTFTNSQVAGGHILAIDGNAVSDNIALDVSAVASGSYNITGGSGDDTFRVGANLVASDTINGGSATLTGNVLELAGNYAGGLTLSSAHITNIETVILDDGFNYHLTIGSGTGVTQVTGSALTAGHSFYVDGSTTSAIGFSGGAGDDTLIGGTGADTFIDFGGANTITGNGSGDVMAIGHTTTLIYNALSDSHSTGSTLGVDSISSCDLSASVVFDVSAVTGITGGVNAVDTAVTTGTVNRATLATGIASIIDPAHLGVGDAVLLTPDMGNAHTGGYAYLIVDCNGVAGYQASGDLLIELFQPTGTLTTANFS